METKAGVVKPKRSYRRTIVEPVVFILVIVGAMILFSRAMGLPNVLNTIMNTAYALLLDTAFYIMAVCVIMGAISALLTEFGVVALLNKLLHPLMRPIFGLPGAAALGVVTTYLSDNPAILTLADEKGFRKYFRKYQLPALTNLGTAFGMGLIVSTFMLGLGNVANAEGNQLISAILIGNLGAVIGSLVSTRLMLIFTKKEFGKDEWMEPSLAENIHEVDGVSENRGSVGSRALNALLIGGKSGVDLGMSVIPGILLVCTFVLMLSNGAPETGFTGAAYEGIGLLPKIADKLSFIITPMFGFASAEAIAVPITALGAAGAAIGLVPALLESGAANIHDIAVFTAMCMCWSGYLSTHVSMMDSLGFPKLTGKAILSHTIGGIVAGVAANWIFALIF